MFEKKSVFKWLIFCNLMLVVLYLVSNYIFIVPSYTIRHWFDLDAESNIPTWFSSSQLLVISGLSVIYSRQIEKISLRRFYVLISFVFMFFSADETAGFHEGLTSILNKLSISSFFPGSHGIWILIYPVILIVLCVIFWSGFVAFLSEKTGRLIFLIGAVVFVAGGVGLEMIGYYLPDCKKSECIFKIIEVTAEEGLELFGQSLIIYALLSKLYSNNFIASIASYGINEYK